jgi:hypothetical protein
MMKRVLIGALLAAGLVPPAAGAQEPGLLLRSRIGVFAPGLPLVAVADGYHPSVHLAPGPLFGLDAERGLTGPLTAYAGIAAAFSRLHHSGVMELSPGDGTDSSRATLLMPTAGILVTPRIEGLLLRPMLRLGAGAKVYRFDLTHATSPVWHPTADLGVGFTSEAGGLRFFTEARWMPSRFDARYLPIRATDGFMQTQADWQVQLGFGVSL